MRHLVYIFLLSIYDTAPGQVNYASVIDVECSNDNKCCTKNTISGSCLNCKDGYHGLRCTLLCPDKCPTCTDTSNNLMYPGFANCTYCSDGYYSTTESFQCQTPCSDGCKECVSFMNPAENCKTCKDGYHLVLLTDYTGRCDRCPTNCRTCASAESCKSCSSGYFGIICNSSCSLGCKEAVCDKGTGGCTNGCVSEYFENITCDRCKAGKYGLACTDACSSVCLNTICERYTGDCVRCAGNFDGSQCDKCKDGHFGTYCNVTCSIHCEGGICEQLSGDCVSCKEGFTGKECSKCLAGKYGPTCNLACPDNCMNNICNRSTGNCEECAYNFNGLRCDSCKNGFYGQGCSLTCSANCGGICNRIDGTCSSCVPDRYGSFCEKYCPVNCYNSECHLETGMCINGCKSGYSGDKCCANHGKCLKCSTNDLCLECVVGMYGEACNESCQFKCLDKKCHKDNGTCLKCQVPYERLLCNETSPVTEMDKGGTGNGQVGVITGSVVGAAVLISVLMVFLVFFRKRLNGRLFGTSGAQNGTEVFYENQNFTHSQSNVNLNISTSRALQDKRNQMTDRTKEDLEAGNIKANVIDTKNHGRGENKIYEELATSGHAENPYTTLLV